MTATYFAQDHVNFWFLADAIGLPGNHAHLHREGNTHRNAISIPSTSVSGISSILNNVHGRYEKCIVLGNKYFWIWQMSWASQWWSRDSRDLWWCHRWSKGGTTITHAHDEKRRLGNAVRSIRMSKSIKKSFLLNILNRHTGVIAQTWTKDI